MSKFLAGDFEP